MKQCSTGKLPTDGDVENLQNSRPSNSQTKKKKPIPLNSIYNNKKPTQSSRKRKIPVYWRSGSSSLNLKTSLSSEDVEQAASKNENADQAASKNEIKNNRQKSTTNMLFPSIHNSICIKKRYVNLLKKNIYNLFIFTCCGF